MIKGLAFVVGVFVLLMALLIWAKTRPGPPAAGLLLLEVHQFANTA